MMEEDYDVVVDVLQKHRDKLWKMNQTNANVELGFGIMDQIRFEQMDQLDKAIKMWKEHNDVASDS